MSNKERGLVKCTLCNMAVKNITTHRKSKFHLSNQEMFEAEEPEIEEAVEEEPKPEAPKVETPKVEAKPKQQDLEEDALLGDRYDAFLSSYFKPEPQPEPRPARNAKKVRKPAPRKPTEKPKPKPVEDDKPKAIDLSFMKNFV
jgi:hypothetical protein